MMLEGQWTLQDVNVCECEICKSVLADRKSRLPIEQPNYDLILERNSKFFPEEVCKELEKLMFNK